MYVTEDFQLEYEKYTTAIPPQAVEKQQRHPELCFQSVQPGVDGGGAHSC